MSYKDNIVSYTRDMVNAKEFELSVHKMGAESDLKIEGSLLEEHSNKVIATITVIVCYAKGPTVQ